MNGSPSPGGEAAGPGGIAGGEKCRIEKGQDEFPDPPDGRGIAGPRFPDTAGRPRNHDPEPGPATGYYRNGTHRGVANGYTEKGT